MTTTLLVAALAVAVVAAARGTWSPCGESMISAINPMAERSRGHRYGVTAAWYLAGATLGGLGLGLLAAPVAAALGPLAGTRWLAAVGAGACLVTLAADLRLRGFRLPLHARQVNELWLGRYRRWIYAAGFGVQIGAGLATYVMTSAVYLTVVLAALTASVPAAVLVGAVFGAARGLAVLLTARVRQPADLYRLHAAVERHEPHSRAAAAAVQAGAAMALAAAVAPIAAVTAAGLLGLAVLAARVHQLHQPLDLLVVLRPAPPAQGRGPGR